MAEGFTDRSTSSNGSQEDFVNNLFVADEAEADNREQSLADAQLHSKQKVSRT